MTADASDAETEVVTMSTTASGVPVRVVPNGWRPKEDCLTLAKAELAWLDQFRAQLLEEFAGLVEDIIVYGFRARGFADTDLGMDVLVVIEEGYPEVSEQIGDLGYDVSLAIGGGFPNVRTLTRSEWEKKKRNGGHYYRAPSSEGISVL